MRPAIRSNRWLAANLRKDATLALIGEGLPNVNRTVVDGVRKEYDR